MKACFNNFNYQFKHEQNQGSIPVLPEEYRIENVVVKKEIGKKYEQLRVMADSIGISMEIQELYDQFYQQTYFLYD